MTGKMQLSSPPEAALITVRGRPATMDEALDAAADLLIGARLPLIYGLVDTTVEAQQQAVALADLLGAVVDSASSASHGSSVLAFQHSGRVSATLGEVKNRADLIIFWGVDPDASHPGFLERFTTPAPDAPTPWKLAVDVGDARSPRDVDDRLSVLPEREVEALWALRMLIRGRRVEESGADTLGSPLERLREFAGRLVGSGYPIIFHAGDPPPERRNPLRATALATLAAEANSKTRLRLIGIRMPGNPVGAENVLTWQTGYPFAVHFGRGYPRYGPGEFTGEALLARSEADAALVVGTRLSHHLSDAALSHLRRIPTVVVGSADALPDGGSRVMIPTAPPDDTPGGFYRMDGVPLRRRVAAPEQPTDVRVLEELANRVRQRKYGGEG